MAHKMVAIALTVVVNGKEGEGREGIRGRRVRGGEDGQRE